MSKTINQPGGSILAVDLSSIVELTDERLYELCRANRELRLERTAEGELLIMSAAGGQTGRRNAQIIYSLTEWANRGRTGIVFDSSGGFKLPSGAIRSHDAAWVRFVPWFELSDEQKEKFVPLSPNFVVELRSAGDGLSELRAKMEEYLNNGVQLGWLIDPHEKRVYRQQAQEEVLDDPDVVAGDPVLPGFILPLQEIW